MTHRNNPTDRWGWGSTHVGPFGQTGGPDVNVQRDGKNVHPDEVVGVLEHPFQVFAVSREEGRTHTHNTNNTHKNTHR